MFSRLISFLYTLCCISNLIIKLVLKKNFYFGFDIGWCRPVYTLQRNIVYTSLSVVSTDFSCFTYLDCNMVIYIFLVLAVISAAVVFLNNSIRFFKKQNTLELDPTCKKNPLPELGIVGVWESGNLEIYYPKPIIIKVKTILVVTVVDGRVISYKSYSANPSSPFYYGHIIGYFFIAEIDGYNAVIFDYKDKLYVTPKNIYDLYLKDFTNSSYQVFLKPSILPTSGKRVLPLWIRKIYKIIKLFWRGIK